MYRNTYNLENIKVFETNAIRKRKLICKNIALVAAACLHISYMLHVNYTCYVIFWKKFNYERRMHVIHVFGKTIMTRDVYNIRLELFFLFIIEKSSLLSSVFGLFYKRDDKRDDFSIIKSKYPISIVSAVYLCIWEMLRVRCYM